MPPSPPDLQKYIHLYGSMQDRHELDATVSEEQRGLGTVVAKRTSGAVSNEDEDDDCDVGRKKLRLSKE
ncbi:hypothetical protein Cni_G16653 [Canna indica]|uniref:Uncharacterized protein n=1 Tax=Canna indica TaxID=4628 RepID=A0AAQ3QG24_9LILI|nr:hypothetical protein Cni_G16653 [Canna indica]